MVMESNNSKKTIADECYSILLEGIKCVSKKHINFAYYSAKGTKTSYRERVFCYELYHQIRKIQEEHTAKGQPINFDVNGEPDKRGQELFKTITGPIPDIIIHTAGSCENNFVVLEAKCNLRGQAKCSRNGNPTGVYKDFMNLADFIKKVQYQYGVFLTVGVKEQSLKNKFTKLAKFLCEKYPDSDIAPIFSCLRIIQLIQSDEQKYSIKQYRPRCINGECQLENFKADIIF